MRIRGLGDTQKAPPMWSSKPTMLLGIDVSHPQSMDASEPSLVGIVASLDTCAAPKLLSCEPVKYLSFQSLRCFGQHAPEALKLRHCCPRSTVKYAHNMLLIPKRRTPASPPSSASSPPSISVSSPSWFHVLSLSRHMPNPPPYSRTTCLGAAQPERLCTWGAYTIFTCSYGL